MTLAARIGGLGGEVVGLDLSPVEALHARVEELLVILRRPGPRAGAVLDGRRDGDGGPGVGVEGVVGLLLRLLLLLGLEGEGG